MLMFVKVLGHAQRRAAFVQNAAAAGRLLTLQGRLPALLQAADRVHGRQRARGSPTRSELFDAACSNAAPVQTAWRARLQAVQGN